MHAEMVDFNQTIQDHGSIHVAVHPLGEMHTPLFTSVCEVIQKCPSFQITESKNAFVTFKFLSSVSNWGTAVYSDFMAHRQIMGVVALCQCVDEDDLEVVSSEFQSLCEERYHGICDSRCIIFGPSRKLHNKVDISQGFVLIDTPECQMDLTDSIDSKRIYRIISDLAMTIHNALSSRIRELGKDFGILDSETMKTSRLLKAPFEKIDESKYVIFRVKTYRKLNLMRA